MANFDRHLGSFGLVRGVESLNRWRIAPLFDGGAGFFSRATAADCRADALRGARKHVAANMSPQLAGRPWRL